MPGRTVTLRRLVRHALGHAPQHDARDTVMPAAPADPELARLHADLVQAAGQYDSHAAATHGHAHLPHQPPHDSVLAVFRSADANLRELARLHEATRREERRLHTAADPVQQRETAAVLASLAQSRDTYLTALTTDLRHARMAAEEAATHAARLQDAGRHA